MNGAIISRTSNRKLVWFAFACAITIHLAAIGFAKSKPQGAPVLVCSFEAPVQGIDSPPDPTEQLEIVSPPEQPPIDSQDFTDETTKSSLRPRTKISQVRSSSLGLRGPSSVGSAKALALYAPKPTYPYEARRGGITGSGIAHLRVNNGDGNIIDARMSQSTGNPILDNATLSAFRRWRFKPGVASNVDVPITYTLSGVSY